MSDLKPLARPSPPIRHPADVARLRAVLNAAGYDASDGDIHEAWCEWSEKCWFARWMIPLVQDAEARAEMLKNLLEHLTPKEKP